MQLASKQSCCGCGACAAVCSHGALSMALDEEGFLRPVCDSSKCVSCGLCVRVCPVLSPGVPRQVRATYAAKASDAIRLGGSTSGGAFAALARTFIAWGGVVIGAAWREDDVGSVAHRIVTALDDLHLLVGSKYAQSDLSAIYRPAAEYLRQGRQVLFSGTPCQTAAFLSYMGVVKPCPAWRDHVVCTTIFCHSVPSPIVFQAYLRDLISRRRITSPITKIEFRGKGLTEEGRRSHPEGYFRLWTSEGMAFECPWYETSFAQCWFGGYSVRPSCSCCAFRSFRDGGDIWLGDYWGIEKPLPGFQDNKGISAVLLLTERGQSLWAEASRGVLVSETTFDDVLRRNPHLLSCTPYPSQNARFIRQLEGGHFTEIMTEYVRPSFLQRVIRKLKSMLKRPF